MAKRKSGLLQAFAKVLGQKPPKKSRKKPHKKPKPASDTEEGESPDEASEKSKGKAPAKAEVGGPSTAPPPPKPKEKSEKEKKMDALKAKKKDLKTQLETTEGKIRQTEKQYCDNEMKFINWWQKRTDIGTQAASELAQLRMDAYNERKDQLLTEIDKLEREGDKLWKKIGHAKVDIRMEVYDSSESSDFSDSSESSSDFSDSSDSS